MGGTRQHGITRDFTEHGIGWDSTELHRTAGRFEVTRGNIDNVERRETIASDTTLKTDQHRET